MKARRHYLFKSVTIAMLIATPAAAQKKYDVGASDTEIKIGNMAPYSGPTVRLLRNSQNRGRLF
jgi:branched-chain amino acid transport system substrate-binding protein